MRAPARARDLPALAATALLLLAFGAGAAEKEYFPPQGEWQRRSPAAAGFDPAALQAAIEFAVRRETARPRDLALEIATTRAREPHHELIGPTRPRGDPTGVILRAGYLVAEWGEPARVDMTFSVTKSLLSAVVGIAHERGLIGDLDRPVRGVLPGDHFESDHNRGVTWDQLLRQTSNWRGTLWDKPDWADRPVGDDPAAWPTMPVPPPGASWKYNDVRVNLLALAALHAWREPLPAVAARELFGPIGASDSWEWHGYDNSSIELDGRRVQSVSGGGHWGGGLFINAYDLARFGLLCERGGRWDGKRIWSPAWQDYAQRPTPQNPDYGVMNWFLNRDRSRFPAAPASAVAHLGNGTNLVYVDPENELVAVVRWIENESVAEFIARLLASLAEQPAAR